MKNRRQWYVLSYDIRNPKRLRRTHAYIKKHGISLQKSVFLVHGNHDDISRLKKGVQARVNLREDDVRIYPVRHPGSIWTDGRQTAGVEGLFSPSPVLRPQSVPARIGALFGWKKSNRG